MLIWIVFALMILAVLGFLLAPLLGRVGREARRADYDLQVYRDQLRELRADVERGVLSASEADAARIEVERRMLRAGDERGSVAAAGRSPWRTASAAGLAIGLPIAAVALYGELGRPDLPSQPLAGRVVEVPRVAQQGDVQPAGQIEEMVVRLANRLKEQPDDYRGWMMLGRSYVVLQRHDEGVAAYRRAAALPEAEADAIVHSALGEALVFAADGVVTPPAAAAFHQALILDGSDPGGRYYLAMSRIQAGDLQAGFDGWLALAKDSPPDVPWMATVRTQLQQLAAQLGIDLEGQLPAMPAPRAEPPAGAQARGPTAEDMAAARNMSGGDRSAMIRSMVEGLAERLQQTPDDFDGWTRLGRSYRVLGEPAKSRDAYARAAALRPDDVGALISYAGAVIAVDGAEGALPAAAVETYRRVLQLDGANPDALWFLGAEDVRLGRAAQALAKWRRLLDGLAPDSPQRADVSRRIEALRAASGAE